jgi:hypothetical protein
MTSSSDLPRSTSLALNLDGVWLEWHTTLAAETWRDTLEYSVA